MDGEVGFALNLRLKFVTHWELRLLAAIPWRRANKKMSMNWKKSPALLNNAVGIHLAD